MALTPTQLELKRQELEEKIAAAKNDVERKKLELELKQYQNERKYDRLGKVGQFVRGVSSLIPGKFRINDPAWYLKLDYIKDLLGKLSFTNPLDDGVTFNTQELNANFTAGTCKYRTCGISVLLFGPTLGGTDSTAIESESINLWKTIRGTATGATNGIDSTLALFYVLCWDSVLMNLAKATRLIGLNNITSDNLNRYKPDALVKALGYDPIDLSDHLSDYVAKYNKIVKQLEAFNIPDGLAYFTKHRWLNTAVMKDRNIRKSQFYMYDCPYSMFWDESNTKITGRLYYRNGSLLATASSIDNWKTNVHGTGALTLGNLFTIIDLQLAELRKSNTLKLINGEIQRAIDAGRLAAMKLPLIDSNLEMEFICHDEPLMQIKNTRVVRLGSTGGVQTDFDITVNASTDVAEQVGLSHAATSAFGHSRMNEFERYLVDVTMDKPTVEDVMVTTRNIPTFKISGNGVSVDHCGDILVIDATIYSYNGNSGLINNYSINSYGYTAFDIETVCAISQFDWFPIIYFINMNSSNPSTVQNFGIFTELNNFSWADKETLNAYHEASIFSLFQIDKINIR